MKKRSIFLSLKLGTSLSNKKAQGDIESYFVIIKLIVAFGVIFAMSAYVYSIVTDTFFDKLYFSRDIAFTLNALYSAPGKIYYEYLREGLNKYIIDFNEQRVKINEEDKKSGLTFDYFYAEDLNYKFKKDTIKDSDTITLQKSSVIFEINNELGKKLKLLKCPEIYTRDVDWQQKFFLIDPGHGDNTGFSNNEIKEEIIVGSIGIGLYNKFQNKDTTRDNTAGPITEQRRKESKEIKGLIEKSDVILSLHMSNSPNNNIKIYVSSVGDKELVNKRKKLGCLIINELFSNNELYNIFNGGNVIGVNPEYVEKDYDEILNNNKISLVIEIGGVQSKKIIDMQNVNTITKIADSIYNGVKEYYEGD